MVKAKTAGAVMISNSLDACVATGADLRGVTRILEKRCQIARKALLDRKQRPLIKPRSWVSQESRATTPYVSVENSRSALAQS